MAARDPNTGKVSPPDDPDGPPKLIPKPEKNTKLYADTDDVIEFAAGLSEDFLYCRELGHNWRPYSAGELLGGKKEDQVVGYYRTLRCSRCETKREQEVTDRGLILRNFYVYPDGYILDGLGRIVGDGRGALRLESITRITGRR